MVTDLFTYSLTIVLYVVIYFILYHYVMALSVRHRDNRRVQESFWIVQRLGAIVLVILLLVHGGVYLYIIPILGVAAVTGRELFLCIRVLKRKDNEPPTETGIQQGEGLPRKTEKGSATTATLRPIKKLIEVDGPSKVD